MFAFGSLTETDFALTPATTQLLRRLATRLQCKLLSSWPTYGLRTLFPGSPS